MVILTLFLLSGEGGAASTGRAEGGAGETGGIGEAGEPGMLMAATRFEGPLDFCGELVPLSDPDIREDLEKELLLILGNRAQVILWLKRSGRYMPYIEKMLAANRMPDDLKYAAIIESSLLPHIGSSAGAVGYWQFIPSTARNYGLTINEDFDERRNLEDATIAAIRYMKDLYAEFASWTLAVAAYNMGEHGLRRRIETQQTRDFYQLYLPMETMRHILKIVAAKMIMTEPERYGFGMVPADYYRPVPTDRVEFQCPAETPIVLIARAAGTYFKKIKDLNPEVRGNNMPEGRHALNVPRGSGGTFNARYAGLLGQWLAERGQKEKQASDQADQAEKHVYVVRRGDSLGGIADRYNVSLRDLLRWNRLNPGKPIYPGQRLVISR